MIARAHLPPLLLITGKGGVGKSTVAVATALALARARRRTALVTITNHPYAQMLRLAETPTHHGVAVDAHLTVLHISSHYAFVDYAALRLGAAKIFARTLDNRMIHALLDATPGIASLMCLGNIWHLATQEKKFDHVIVDLPAFGHALSVLTAPRLVTATLTAGPLYAHGRAIEASLRDPQETALWIVARSEELAVQETAEFDTQFRTLGVPATRIILNGAHDAIASPEMRERYTQNRATLCTSTIGQPLCTTLDFLLARDCARTQWETALASTAGARLRTLRQAADPDPARVCEALIKNMSTVWSDHTAHITKNALINT